MSATPEQESEDDKQPYYPRFIHDQLIIRDTTVININASHFLAYPQTTEFYTHLTQYPMEIVPLMDRLVIEWVQRNLTNVPPAMAAQIKVNHFPTHQETPRLRL